MRQSVVGPLIGILACMATAASACGFHNYAPQPTLVDRLLQSDHIVLARPDPDDPFRFMATRAIEGDAAFADIPFLVDSTSRRRLAADPEAQVLFARDGAYGPWQRVAFVDAEMRPVLQQVTARLPDWEIGDEQDRFATFAALLDHPDPVIRVLALRELDRADYGYLVAHKLRVDPGLILSQIDNPAETELRAIRILLLGFSDSDVARARLERGLAQAIRFQGTLTGAYATALIEMGGPGQARDVARRYLAAPDLTLAAREMVLDALALHGQYGEEDMANAIDLAVAEALKEAPELAPAVARQFGARGVWTQSQTLAAMVRERAIASPLDILAISQYVALAESVSNPDPAIGDTLENGESR